MKCKQQKTNRVGAENKIQTYKLGDEQLKKTRSSWEVLCNPGWLVGRFGILFISGMVGWVSWLNI